MGSAGAEFESACLCGMEGRLHPLGYVVSNLFPLLLLLERRSVIRDRP